MLMRAFPDVKNLRYPYTNPNRSAEFMNAGRIQGNQPGHVPRQASAASGTLAFSLQPLAFAVGPLCPGGTSDNSPAFQRWERRSMSSRPEGTAEPALIQPSLRDLAAPPFQPNAEALGYSQNVPAGQSPALDCRNTVPSARQPLAFTLIEFVGALAIIALIAAALIPVVIRQIDRAAKNAEI